MERLTIKELAPYLPYGIKLYIWNGGYEKPIEYPTLIGLHGDSIIHSGYRFKSIHCGDEIFSRPEMSNSLSIIKPLLRPLPSIELKWFQDNIDEDIEDFRINCETENNHFSVEVCDKILGWSALSLEEYQLFYRNHIDIHGLIDRNLALPIDGKELEG